MKTMIISSTCLFVGFGFIYSAHLDYKNRKKKDCFKPKLYSINGQFYYPILPIFSHESQDNIFLSLIFPAYNEEKRLGNTLDKTIHYFSNKNFNYEIIIVDGGSIDNTFELITKKISEYSLKYDNLKDIICASYTGNGGKGWAVKTGIDISRGKYILMLDSDGSTEIEEFESLYYTIKDDNYSIAIGSRIINLSEKENRNRVWYRNICSKINNLIIKKFLGINNINDSQCGFKLLLNYINLNINNYDKANKGNKKWFYNIF